MKPRNNKKTGKKINFKRIVIDVDGTLCQDKTGDKEYPDLAPVREIVERIKGYKRKGFEIIIYSSRQMRTYNNNVRKIVANTLPVMIEWLDRHEVPYDEIHVGKPWCGYEGFYVDDKTIRPDEFANMTYVQIMKLLTKENR